MGIMVLRTSYTAVLSAVIAVVGAMLFILAGYGYQWGWWELNTAFRTMLPLGTSLGVLGLILGLVFVWAIRPKGYSGGWLAFTGIVVGLALVSNAGYWYIEAQKYPPIHDISTDTENPPQFDAIIPLRADAPNPPEYGGEEVAQIQKEHYPDIGTLFIQIPASEAFDRALEAARETGWEIVSVDSVDLTIEATHTLPWFGFKDDVVIRVDTTQQGSKIDVRSKSRIGRGDIGVNADRIREYLKLIE